NCCLKVGVKHGERKGVGPGGGAAQDRDYQPRQNGYESHLKGTDRCGFVMAIFHKPPSPYFSILIECGSCHWEFCDGGFAHCTPTAPADDGNCRNSTPISLSIRSF